FSKGSIHRIVLPERVAPVGKQSTGATHFLRHLTIKRPEEIPPALLCSKPNGSFVIPALFGGYGRNGSQYSICFIIRPSGEIQRVGLPGRRVVTKTERPQPVNGQRLAGGIFDRAFKFTCQQIECVDGSSSKVADQQAVAEYAKVGGGKYNSPGRVQEPSVLKSLYQASMWIENGNEAQS